MKQENLWLKFIEDTDQIKRSNTTDTTQFFNETLQMISYQSQKNNLIFIYYAIELTLIAYIATTICKLLIVENSTIAQVVTHYSCVKFK